MIKDIRLTDPLQVLQVILFALPILTLLMIGIKILSHAVSIVNRRWYLAFFLPLLLANVLALLTGSRGISDWRTWLILIADVILITGAVWISRGILVYGLKADDVEVILADALRDQGFTVIPSAGVKQDVWGRVSDARILSVRNGGKDYDVWITSRFNEVLVRPQQRTGTADLRRALPALEQQKVPYDFTAHAAGVLFLILALVFAVLAWIFFFEPRLILIE